MQTTGSARGNEVRDGIVFLLGLIALILVIIYLTKITQDEGTYSFQIRFARAQSIQTGAAVQVSGVTVGQVTNVALQPGTNLSLVTVKVSGNLALTTTDTYAVATGGGLVGEKYIDITPMHAGGEPVKAGTAVTGVTTPEITDLVEASSALLTKFNKTADALQTIIGDADTQRNYKQAMQDLQRAAASSAAFTGNLNVQLTQNRAALAAAITDLRNTTHSSSEFTAGMNRLLQQNQADLTATIAGLRQTTASSADVMDGLNQLVRRNAKAVDGLVADLGSVSKDLRQISETLTPQLTGSKMVANLDTASAHVAKLTERLDNVATSVERLFDDKELATMIRESAEHMRKASADLEVMLAEARKAVGAFPGITADLQTASANMREASVGMRSAGSDLPLITRPFRETAPETADNVLTISRSLRQTSNDVGGMARKLTRIGSTLANLRLEPDGRVTMLTDGAQATRGDANLDVRGATTLLRLGGANLGNGNQVNIQLGTRLSPDFWLRGGLVQSKAGMGLDFLPTRNLRFSGELFDPKSPRANFQADYRLGGAWWLSGGWYDMMDRQNTPGAGIVFRP